MFNGEELLDFLKLATWCTVNDYEAKLLSERTGRSIEDLAREVEALVVTMGANGSEIHAGGQRIVVPSVKPDGVVDPTGCGDAYRAGLLYGIAQGWSWLKAGRLAALMGSIKIAHRGGQNHKPAREEIARRFEAAFGEVF
jgi:adenosine kinase